MDVAPSAQNHDDSYGSWHPAMRPNSQHLEGANEKPTNESLFAPLPSADKQDEGEPLKELLDKSTDFRRLGRPQHHMPLSVQRDSEKSTNAARTAQSDIHVGRDANDLVDDVNGQTYQIDTQEPDLSGGALRIAWERAAAGTGLSEAFPQSGQSQDNQSHDLLSEGVGAQAESEAPAGLATKMAHVGNALGAKEEMAKAWESMPSYAGDPRPGDVSRTNSFPRVPTLQQTESGIPHSLSHSQAEQIMQDEKRVKSMIRSPSLASLSAADSSHEAQQQPLPEMIRDESESLIANIVPAETIDATLQAEEDARFEEGLPLMHAPEHSPLKIQSHNSVARIFSHGEDEEDDFFEGTSQPPSDEASSTRPQALDRKSTTQVLDALNYAPHSATHQEPQSAEKESPVEILVEGGTTASSSIANTHDYTEEQNRTVKAQPKDDDLADLWRAALGDDDLLEDAEDALDPSSFFEDDGEGFLEGGEDQVEAGLQATPSPPMHEPHYASDGSMEGHINSRQPSSRAKYLPDPIVQPFPKYDPSHSNRASTHQPLHASSALNHSVSIPGGLGDTNRQHIYAAQTSSSRPQMPASTQSFADKSKGGYTSPYDLPLDVTRPKKRIPHQRLRPNSDAQIAPARPPPPRSSSMFTGALPSPGTEPSVPPLPNALPHVSTGNVLPPPLKASPSIGSFFEELPSSKPRPSNSMSRTAYPTSQPTPPPPISSHRDLSRTQQSSTGIDSASQRYQLLPPEKMGLYTNASQPESGKQMLPVANTRYSPAPVQQSNIPPPRARYAASPSVVSRPVPSQTLSFQPRTSSPLAQNSSLPRGNHQPSISDPPLHRPTSSGRQAASAHDSVPSSSYPHHRNANWRGPIAEQSESTRKIENNLQSKDSPQILASAHYAPLSSTPSDSSHAMETPDADHASSDGSSSFQKSHKSPIYASGTSVRAPPFRRSQSQSPDNGRLKPELLQSTQNQHERPASVNNQTSVPLAEIGPSLNQIRQRERTLSKDLSYLIPSDGREMDHLERWKGCPIITFGFGGTIVTSFPKQVPRYAAGQSTPMIKCSSGEVKIRDEKALPLAEDVATFPGPLRSKSKKKDVLDWLQKRIFNLKVSGPDQISIAALPDPRRRYEEKILLWEIVRVLIEYDGVVDGNASAQTAIRSVLSPELTVGDSATLPSQSFNLPLLGISRNSGSGSSRDLVKPEAMEDLRKLLLHGEREKAVWHAVDNQLWAHAMLLASSLERDVWRQVSQEFVRQEVKTFGVNTESLAALYQIFAGNWDESMDELVPPSARAGLQLVSKTANTGPTKNALDGLDRWRETLTLILSNRTVDDGRAVVSLGQLLAGYGRVEAAHVCFIFAKSPGLFGGPDDPNVSVALLGADHVQQPFDYGKDLDCILLTEVYDFAHTVLAPSSAATISPHLQSYKLYHAMILAECGYKSEAQQYCEMITSALNSTTKRSPHYHYLLFGALEDLVDRLRQAPRDSSGSWISKPSIDKVSGSIWAKFNQYVAGDENDAVSTGSGKALEQDIGPFARVAGDSPNLSRTPSSSDMYNAYAPGIGVSQLAPIGNLSNSRYAPGGLYTPRSSLEQAGNSSQDYQRPTQAQKDSLRPGLAPQQHQSRSMSSNVSYPESVKPVNQPSSYPLHTESYLPTPPSQPGYMPVIPPENPSSSFYQKESHQPTPPLKPVSSHEQYQSLIQSGSAVDSQPSSTTYESPSYTYGPPSTDNHQHTSMESYDPPAYDPYVPKAEDSPVEERSKKKSFMNDDDDDDDFEARAAALRKEEKARKDREADEVFRRAAEADGM